MNQRLVIFIAVVCIAQLGVTVFQHVEQRPGGRAPRAQVTKSMRTTPTPGADLDAPITDRASLRSISAEDVAPVATAAPTPASHGGAAQQAPVVAALLNSPNQDSSAPLARDPFVPFYAVRKESDSSNTNPLTRFELKELRLAAVIRDPAGSHSALVETNQGKTFIVKKGHKIGSRGGEISEITPSKILITEPAQDGLGRRPALTQELSMKSAPKPEGMTIAGPAVSVP